MPRGRTPNARAHLYFAQSRGDATIKIGASSLVDARVDHLAKQHRDELALLLVCRGQGHMEHAVHRALLSFRVRKPRYGILRDAVARGGFSGFEREWFAPAPEVLALIDRLRVDPAANVRAALADAHARSELDLYLAEG